MRRRAAPNPRQRPRILAVAGLVAVVLAVVAGALLVRGNDAGTPVAVDSAAPGRLEARQSTIDLGRVAFDARAEARFELANTGSKPVRLTAPPRVRMLEGC